MKRLVSRSVREGVTWETWEYVDHLIVDVDGNEFTLNGTATSADAGSLDLGIIATGEVAVTAEGEPDMTLRWETANAAFLKGEKSENHGEWEE